MFGKLHSEQPWPEWFQSFDVIRKQGHVCSHLFTKIHGRICKKVMLNGGNLMRLKGQGKSAKVMAEKNLLLLLHSKLFILISVHSLIQDDITHMLWCTVPVIRGSTKCFSPLVVSVDQITMAIRIACGNIGMTADFFCIIHSWTRTRNSYLLSRI